MKKGKITGDNVLSVAPGEYRPRPRKRGETQIDYWARLCVEDAVLAEREACAKIPEKCGFPEIAAAIRARGAK